MRKGGIPIENKEEARILNTNLVHLPCRLVAVFRGSGRIQTEA